MLSFVIVAKMELGFQLAVIALGLSVTAAGFLYFFYDANLYRGLKEDQPESEHLITTVSKETEEEDEGWVLKAP